MAVIRGIERPHIAKASMYDSSNIIDFHELFNVGNSEIPFVKELQLVGIDGQLVRIWALFDDGAMVNVIDANIFASLKHRLSTCKPSHKVLWMENGTLVASEGSWTGTIIIGDVHAEGTFKIFPSNGAWAALFGKPLLKAFSVSHEYAGDMITLKGVKHQSVITNDFISRKTDLNAEWLRKSKVTVVSISNLGDHFGGSPLRQRQVPNIKYIQTIKQDLDLIQELDVRLSLPDNIPGISRLEPIWFSHTARVKGQKREVTHQKCRECKKRAKVLPITWKQIKGRGRIAFKRKVAHLRARRCRLEKHTLEETENSYNSGFAEGL